MKIYDNIKTSAKAFVNNIGTAYIRWQCLREYKNQTYINTNERSIEFAFVFRQLVDKWPKTILDVGTGMTALPHVMRNCGFLVTAIDNIKDYWSSGMVNRHYHVINDDITNSSLKEKFDVITCISVLEHIQQHQKAIKSMYDLLNPNGMLIITCPYNEGNYVPNVYKLPDSIVRINYPFSTQAFSRNEINTWLKDTGFTIQEQEYWQFWEGDYWTCGKILDKPIRVTKEDKHQLTCLSLIKPST